MDKRLIDAAEAGNVQDLHDLIKVNPLLLRAAALEGGETPLHIACMAGHIDFVKEIIKLRPEFAMELNQDGLSPLHIASANGDFEVVRELLQVNNFNLCSIKGKERRIPLHYAAIKGRVHVIRELLLSAATPDSVMEVTARGETLLHLALKNNQFEAFKFMAEYLKQCHREEILNKKNNQGDTILHFAASTKQYEVVELLVDKNIFGEGTVEVNSLNKSAFTPLDVLLSKGGDYEMEEMLVAAGARKAEDLLMASSSPPDLIVTTQNPSPPPPERPQSLSKQLQNYFKYDKVRDSPGEVRNTLLVVAVLIATATYQAVNSPPGGVWQDDYLPSNNTTAATSIRPHTAGKAVMGTHNVISYSLFLFFNSIGFFMSIHMINFLTLEFPLQMELQVSLLALSVTYDTSMAAITPIRGISLGFTVTSILLPFIIHMSTRFLRNNLKKARCTFRRVNHTCG